MIRQRISTLLTTLSLVLSLTAVSVAVPATTLAALPDLQSGRGTYIHQLIGTSASPTMVSPSTLKVPSYAAFSIWAYNNDTSTISQLFLSAVFPAGVPAGSVQSVTWSKSGGSDTACQASDPLNCGFGQLKPRQWIDAKIVYKVPNSGTSMDVPFVWSTVGLGHGYTFPDPDGVLLSTDPTNFAGTYVVDSGLVTVGDAGVAPGNSQSTAAAVHNSGIPVTVQDGFTSNTPGDPNAPPNLQTCHVTTTFDCTGFFGDWSSVNVDNNNVFDSVFTITITIDAAFVPNGVNKNNIAIYHQYQDESGTWHEEIAHLGCSGGTLPCFTLTTTKSLWTLVIQTKHNGLWRNI
jgi:hypothetical protein